MHLSNNNKIMAMIFYSILTFFVGPLVTREINLFGDYDDQCVGGFLIGFTISICLWMRMGRNL